MSLAAILPHVITASIVLVVVGLGSKATWQDAFSLFRRPGLLLRSILSMNLVMPLVAVAFVVAFDLPFPVEVALLALAISPVPPMLPQKERKAGGDSSYAIGLVVAIALLSIVTVPITVSWLTRAFGRPGEVAPFDVAKTVLMTVAGPLAVGIALRRWAPVLADRIARPLAMLGMAMLALAVLPLLYAFWPAVNALFGSGTVWVLVAMATIGLVVGHALGGPHAHTRTVLALSTASRHPAIALASVMAVAVASGVEPRPAIATVLLYVVVAALVSIPYVAWRRHATSGTAMAATARVPN